MVAPFFIQNHIFKVGRLEGLEQMCYSLEPNFSLGRCSSARYQVPSILAMVWILNITVVNVALENTLRG